jgi:hypothetical protein
MKQYVICKDEAERAKLLKKIEKIGVRWNSGKNATDYYPYGEGSFSIGYIKPYTGIAYNCNDNNGKQTTLLRFLISLRIEMLKRERRALPKLGEEVKE